MHYPNSAKRQGKKEIPIPCIALQVMKYPIFTSLIEDLALSQ